MNSPSRSFAVCSLAKLTLLVTLGAGPSRSAEDGIRFNRDIRPLLSENCFSCHGPDGGHRKAGLRVDTFAGATREGRSGAAIVPGDPARSLLVERIRSTDDDERMPPPDSGHELEADEIALLERWVAEGAEYESHWSFTTPRRPVVPEDPSRWSEGDVDRFLVRRMRERGLEPSTQADPATLVRRIAFDLTGLPPTSDEVAGWTADPSSEAWRRLVDRLLESPHFGERMAIHWLDLVRYADTVGYHGDQEHHASPYRDWVIAAFNANMPFDRFTAAQLAGDLLPDASTDDIIATAYNRILQTTHEGGAQDKEYLAKYAADRVRNLSTVWMGATMGCAECHNHKYDPYTQRDFYSLAAFFADIKEQGAFSSPNSSPTIRSPEIEVLSPLTRADVDRLESEISALRAAGSGAEERIAELEARRDELAKDKRHVMVTQTVDPRTVRVLPRGDFLDETGEVVEPSVPEFLPPLDVEGRRANRLDLARWLTSREHPQTARNFVNRLWDLFFGVGLSKVLEDTGSQGEWPTHPDLLDWLAVEFVESGWDVKHVIRLIVTSRAYRQTSVPSADGRRLDLENRWFARQARFRLPAEMIRDAALRVSGLLVDRLGGPSARPYQPKGYYANLNFPEREYVADSDASQYRRGVYMHWQRQFLHPMLRAFDAPSREECTARRPVSNTPLAALTLLNDPTFVEAARVFAARIIEEGGATDAERLAWAFRSVTSRAAETGEVEVLRALLDTERREFLERPEAARALLSVGLSPSAASSDPNHTSEFAAWASVARVLLNLSEAVTRN